jgi:hypothetical protein
MAAPASLDAGEITDKGYVNQRKVLARRAALVEMLYADPAPPGVVVAERKFQQPQKTSVPVIEGRSSGHGGAALVQPARRRSE